MATQALLWHLQKVTLSVALRRSESKAPSIMPKLLANELLAGAPVIIEKAQVLSGVNSARLLSPVALTGGCHRINSSSGMMMSAPPSVEF